jgi:hypothetical protein
MLGLVARLTAHYSEPTREPCVSVDIKQLQYFVRIMERVVAELSATTSALSLQISRFVTRR